MATATTDLPTEMTSRGRTACKHAISISPLFLVATSLLLVLVGACTHTQVQYDHNVSCL